ncbi:putative Bug-like extracytoplasmic solute binding receptor, TTT family [Advenella mimigardefordensis DPN7]|uniref:Putative Bug-like extracytoplasmic solute binding receptor, TTT family n=2 Tax=Advenella mimigardefordensis TaxID=302406 RepID=W0PF50_ADVMD|nr:putative Bug-like extracytoplasmic solute binding receptor, TTT family [Advenella mimigardefordensis DPN7]
MKYIFSTILACSISAMPLAGHAAESYPSKPIKLVVPFLPGGIGDVLGRIVGAELSERLGQTVIIENRAGAGGMIGTEYAAKTAPDGYTILQVSSPQIINQVLREKPGYELLRDFVPVSSGVTAPLVLVVPASSKTQSVKDLISVANSRSGGVNFGSGGVGSVGHLAGEMLKRSADIAATHVAYKGNAGVVTDLVGGRLDFFFSSQPEAVHGDAAGTMRAIAVTAPERVKTFPDVPTMIESGYKDFTPTSVYGYMVPKNTPAAIVNRLHDAINSIVTSSAVQNRFETLGLNADPGNIEHWKDTLESETARWRELVKTAGVHVE